jgi:biopolymer transport protein ExbB/TolQ
MFSSLLPIPAAGVYYAFEKSDLVGQAIVVFLLFGSIFTWTIMIEKGVFLFRCKKMSELFILLMKRRRRLSEMYRESRNDGSPLACVYKAGMDKLMEFYAISPDQLLMGPDHYNVRKLSEIQNEAVRIALEREVSYQIEFMEKRIGMLATVVSACPFFGLLGTVWGIMIAFVSMAAQGRAEVGGLAPGISGALLCTVTGMIVAIPSMIGYNLLTINIRSIIVRMDNFVEEFMARVNLEQLDADKAKE